MKPHNTFCGRTRREFLWESGAGFTSLGLTGLLAGDGFFANQAAAADAEETTAMVITATRRTGEAAASAMVERIMRIGVSSDGLGLPALTCRDACSREQTPSARA